MHRLVQLSTQNWLELQGTKARWQVEALELLAERFPSGEYETWNECEVLYPSAQVVVGYLSTIGSHLLQYAKLLGNLARYDKMQGWYNISYNRFIKLLNIHEAVPGKEHPDTLTSMNNLAGVLDSQGKYDEAEAMFQQVLGLRETVVDRIVPLITTLYLYPFSKRQTSCRTYPQSCPSARAARLILRGDFGAYRQNN
jgi:tetratricopeptide (TPR) repeat protein